MSNSIPLGAQHILAAAEPWFASGGFAGVSIQQIAKEANISKANIYHHFNSKDELYLAVLRYAFQDMNQLLKSLQHIEGSPKEQIAHFASEHLKHLLQKQDLSRLVLRELLDSNSSRGQALARDVFSEYFERLQILFRKGQSCGEIRSDIDADHLATALVGMNVFLFQSWSALQHFPESTFQNQEKSGEIMFDLLLNGIAPQGSST